MIAIRSQHVYRHVCLGTDNLYVKKTAEPEPEYRIGINYHLLMLSLKLSIRFIRHFHQMKEDNQHLPITIIRYNIRLIQSKKKTI